VGHMNKVIILLSHIATKQNEALARSILR
jgi:hypothetical protein